MTTMTTAKKPTQPNMYQRKTPSTRKNYFLTAKEKKAIKAFIRKNPDLSQTEIGLRFGVSRGTISNIARL